MEVLLAIQSILKVAQGFNDTKLTQEIINLQQSVLKVVSENNDFLKANLKLQSEIEELKLRLEIKEKIEFKEDSYWLGEEGPYCVACFDSNNKLCRVIKDNMYNQMKCPTCGFTYTTKEQKQSHSDAMKALSSLV